MPLSLFTKLYGGLPLPVIVAGMRSGYPLVHANGAARLLLGLTDAGGEEGLLLARFVRPARGLPFPAMMAGLFSGGRAEAAILARSGEELTAEMTAERLELMGQDYAVCCLLMKDTRHEILETITANMNSLIAVNSLDSYRILYANQTLADARGKAAGGIVGMPCWKALRHGKDGPCRPCHVRRMVEEGGELPGKACVWEFHDTNLKKWYLMRDVIVRWVDGELAHLQIATDITSQKQYERELEQAASIDFMTGVYNREWGYKLMQEILVSAQYQQQTLSLCFIDLDGLKCANDTYGHSAGDDMILTITGVIRRSIRKSDVMFRWGGDEFVLLLRCDVVIAARVIESIQSELELLNLNGSRPYTLSFSCGVVDFSGADKESLDVIIAEADRIMYAEKLAKQQQQG